MFENYLIAADVPAAWALAIGRAASVLLLALLAVLTNVVTRLLIMRGVEAVTRKTNTDLDDILFDKGAFSRLSHIAPALAIYALSPLLLPDTDLWSELVRITVNVYVIIIGYLVLDAVLNAGIVVVERTHYGNRVAIKSLVQAVKVVAACLTFILALSAIFDRNPLYFMSGLGALTAVLLLVFRDAILGLVAGIQLSVNDIVRVGDWIEMPGQGADGDVIDISLTVVKVQNWDRTITSIPTYALVSNSFRNWRGMTASGGRRIKRAIRIDTETVRFADDALLDRLQTLQVFEPWLRQRRTEIQQHNQALNADLSVAGNGRRLTNIGLFRAYCVEWLRDQPRRHPDMTFLVRQLEPGPDGVPIELYLFANTTVWVAYEDFQADIVDHLLAVLPLFELRAFQNPSAGVLRDLVHARPTGS